MITRAQWPKGLIAGASLAAATIAMSTVPAEALPLYARQTGQECAACHNGFPELTPYGRLFKLNGYTFSSGQSKLPPVSMMVIGSMTHTEADQAGGAAPHYAPNDNFTLDAVSVFYGGRIAENFGAFGQITYNPIARNLNWDNTDFRFAKATNLMDRELILGVSVNNNPGLSDVWNSTPAWGYPYQSSGLAPGPGAKTLIEGGLAQLVVGSSVYGFWNRLVYAEVGAYRGLSMRTDATLGVDPNAISFNGLVPYWRFALEPRWGRNTFEVGTFGMAASINPGRVTGYGHDHTVDIGLDTQYQFMADRDSVSVQGRWITEHDNFTATQALGGSTYSSDHLRSLAVKTTYYRDQTYGGTVGFFRIDGSGDPGLYGGLPSLNNSPNSQGWIGELNYLPFNHGGPSFWPWLNVKFGLQYVHYDKFNGASDNFDGAGTNAHANDTLYLYSWLAF